jgi:hypothetical protein
MMEKVFCIGFSKTGTTSLEYALEKLGYNVCHGHWNLKHNDYLLALWIHQDLEEIRRMSRYWDAFADAPWGGTELYRALHSWYPDAKFVLTLREPEDWYRSLERMLTRFDSSLQTALDTFHARGRFGFVNFVRHRFEISQLVGNKDKIIERYRAHYELAEEYLIHNKANFAKLDCTQEDGWRVLCPFLGKDTPPVPYPRLNVAPMVRPQVDLAIQERPRFEVGPSQVRGAVNRIRRILSIDYTEV